MLGVVCAETVVSGKAKDKMVSNANAAIKIDAEVRFTRFTRLGVSLGHPVYLLLPQSSPRHSGLHYKKSVFDFLLEQYVGSGE